MRVGLLAAFVLIMTANAAKAHQWYVIDAGNGTCGRAPWTPAQLISDLRSEGSIPNVKVVPTALGRMVTVTGHIAANDTGQILRVWFFTNDADCNRVLGALQKSGVVPNYNELK